MQANPRRRRFPLAFAALLFVFVLIPYLFWRGTWFGTKLTQSQMRQYLADKDKPRKVQHALVQIERQMVDGNSDVRRWYPELLKLSDHASKEIRITVAWVMGQDAAYAPFHQALLKLLRDEQPMVRRNAALSLVRFHDLSGKQEILSMLRPYLVAARSGGTATILVSVGDPCAPGKLLARIQNAQGTDDVQAPIPGSVGELLTHNGDSVGAGQTLLTILSDENQIWEALRALYLIGSPEDLPYVSKCTSTNYPERIQRQAKETARAIQSRAR
ncbi:MAG TPA: HEAT repeat domain-containing protein [Acidobacteriota bacterium]|jgi:acetyl/propionyl-CoA carboxylase alpha subunit